MGDNFHIPDPTPPHPRLVCWLTRENYLKPLEYVSQVFSFVIMLFMLGTKVSHGYRHADSLPGKPVQVHRLGDLDGTAALSAVWRCCFLSSNMRICKETPSPTMGSKDFKALLRSCRAASLSSGETSSFVLSACGKLCLEESWQAWQCKGHKSVKCKKIPSLER